MPKPIIAIWLLLQLQSAVAQDLDTTGLSAAITRHLATVKKTVERVILPGRYMCNEDSRLISTSDTLPGWEGFPVQLYEYKISDRHDGMLTTRVYLLNADANRLARWVIAACWMVKRSVTDDDIHHLTQHIADQSGGQFPIRGIVYEDLNEDGIQETYPFFDGISVSHKEFSIRSPQKATPEQQQKYLSMTFKDIKKVYDSARIISTSRDQLKSIFPNADVAGNNWCNVIREEYKKAMKSDVNYLITAWAKANL